MVGDTAVGAAVAGCCGVWQAALKVQAKAGRWKARTMRSRKTICSCCLLRTCVQDGRVQHLKIQARPDAPAPPDWSENAPLTKL
jgi:hypothetical protein